ncbi:alpha/beta hydrolase [bacterium]|nr:alpha/beta hydrolase [bacterium]
MRSEKFSVPISGEGSVLVRAAVAEGTPLFLMHGGPGGTDYLFPYFAVRAAEAGYRAIGICQRGTPGSPSDGPFTADANIEDMEAVRQYLGAERIGVLGHSWGGVLSTFYSSRHPERVERLTLICPIGPRKGWLVGFRKRVEQRLSAAESARVRQLKEQADAAPTPEERGRLMAERSNIMVHTYYAPLHREGKPGLANLTWEVYESVMASVEDWYNNTDWELGLDGLDCPITIIHGEQDVVPPSVPRDYANLFPTAHFIAMKTAGHFPWLEEPEEFNAHLEVALAD